MAGSLPWRLTPSVTKVPRAWPGRSWVQMQRSRHWGRRLVGLAAAPGPWFPALRARGSGSAGLGPGTQVSVGPGRRDGPQGGCARGIWPSLVAWRMPGRDQVGDSGPRWPHGGAPVASWANTLWAARLPRAEGYMGEEWWHLLAEGAAEGPPTGQVRSPSGGSGRVWGPSPRAQGGAAEPMCVRSEGLGCRHLAMSGHGLGTVA